MFFKFVHQLDIARDTYWQKSNRPDPSSGFIYLVTKKIIVDNAVEGVRKTTAARVGR
jgi:hypothetical protein